MNTLYNMTLEELLQRHEWLLRMLEKVPDPVLPYFEVQEVKPDEMVCEQDYDPSHFFILVSGRLKVQYILPDGHVQIVTYLEPEQFVSDIELAVNRPYVSRVSAVVSSTLLALPVEQYLQWLRKDEQLLYMVYQEVSEKLYRMAREMAESSYLPLKLRILKYLLDKVTDFDFTESVVCLFSVSRENWAHQFGVSVRSINRVLKELKEENFISTDRTYLIISDWNYQKIKHELQKYEK